MIFYICDADGTFLYKRDDAIDFIVEWESYACEGTFPVSGKPIEVGQKIAFVDDSARWHAFEVTATEFGVFGDDVIVTGVDLALAELRDQILKKVAKIKKVAFALAVNSMIVDAGWTMGMLPPGARTLDELRVKSTTGLYTAPGNGKRIKSYSRGNIVVNLGDSTSADWYHVQTKDNRVGYIQKSKLDVVGKTKDDEYLVSCDTLEWVTPWEVLETYCEDAKAIMMPRIVMGSRGIEGKVIDFYATSPEYGGVRLTTDVNVVDGTVTYDTSELHTALYLFGKKDKGIGSVTWRKSDGDPLDKPKNQEYLEDPDATAVYGRLNARGERLPRFGVMHVDDAEDMDDVMERGYKALQIYSVPKVTIECGIGDLYKLGYGGQPLQWRDSVYVIMQPLGRRVEAFIAKFSENLVKPEASRITIGTVSEEDIVASVGAAISASTSVEAWQIKNVSGSSIVEKSITADQIVAGAIKALAVGVDALEANNIAAGQITTEHISAKGIAADCIKGGTLDADLVKTGVIEAVVAKLQSITANDIATDSFAAAIANLGILTAGDATIRKAVVETLLASAMTITDAVGENIFIDNLSVKQAQMIEATIGTLTVKASDGKYYRLDFDSAGNIAPVEVTVTDAEISAGVTSDGTRRIVESSMTVADLSASSFKAVSALINRLTADQVDVGTLWARQGFIDELTTARIDAQGTTLTMVASNANSAKTTADATASDFSRVVRIDADKGLRIGDNRTTNEVVIDSDSVNIEMDGVTYSEFGAKYVQFGNYQLRQSADGGLVFKMKAGGNT